MNPKTIFNNAMNAMKQAVVFTMIFSTLLSAVEASAEKAPTPSLPLPTSGNVTLTLVEYDRLVDLATKVSRKHDVPPISYTLKRAELKLRVAESSVLGSIQLDGEVFGKGAAKVPLTSGMTILNARQESANGKQEGKPLPLLQEGTTAMAILPGSAEFSVALDAGMPMTIEPGRASFNLPVPAAGTVKLMLVIPGDHTNVRISPGLITNKTSANGQTTIEAALVPGQSTSIWWQTREIAVPVVPKEVRYLSDVKTLVTVTESDVRVAALADVTVVQGDPAEFKINVPTDYRITDVSGATVEGSEVAGNELTVRLNNAAPRTHQFIITMEKELAGGTKLETPFVNFKDTQRETGEVLVEGTGAMELTAKEGGSLKRMDVKEVNPYLRSLARYPMHAGFRFHRQPQPDGAPQLALSWVRFPDSSVLAAVAERAVVTTLVTNEGRSLTEVKLTVRNQAQPFLKVDLPKDATILSAEVAGQKVKPVQGTDGSRVPLLRAGFRPTDAYEVSFVFMHSGAPFSRKGDSQLALPSMDIPISLMQWEVFLPEQYKVRDFGGDAVAMSLMQPGRLVSMVTKSGRDSMGGYVVDPLSNLEDNERADHLVLMSPGIAGPPPASPVVRQIAPGQLGGIVTDATGAVVANAKVTVRSLVNGQTQTVNTDGNGTWSMNGMPSGNVSIQAGANGFRSTVYGNTPYDAGSGSAFNIPLSIAAASETVEVTAAAPSIDTSTSQPDFNDLQHINGPRYPKPEAKRDRDAKKQLAQQEMQASVNVFNLQKKVSGVLPVQVDVPRAGNSYKFARALVLDEETKLTFNYKTK